MNVKSVTTPVEAPSTRDRILDGAVRATVAVGIDAVTVQQILDAAEVSRRTYYQYFRSKDDVLLALYEAYSQQMIDRIVAAVAAETDPWQLVQKGVGAYLDHQRDGGPIVYMLQREAIRHGSPLEDRRQMALDLLCAFLEQQTRQVLGVSPDPLVYRGLLLGVEGVILHLQRDDSFTDDDRQRVEAFLGPFMRNVLITTHWLPQQPE